MNQTQPPIQQQNPNINIQPPQQNASMPPQMNQPQPPNQQQASNKKLIKIIILVAVIIPVIIIGILAIIIMLSLSSARDKANITAGKQVLSSIPASIAQCTDFQGTVQPAIAGKNICSNIEASAGIWPSLPDGWIYGQIKNGGTEQASITANCNKDKCGEDTTTTCALDGCE